MKNDLRKQLEARIAAAESILAPYRTDAQRQWNEEGSNPGRHWTPGIADELARSYCFFCTGFANYRSRPESYGWYFLAAEAHAAIQIADDSEDARRWCGLKVAAIECAAEIVKKLEAATEVTQ